MHQKGRFLTIFLSSILLFFLVNACSSGNEKSSTGENGAGRDGSGEKAITVRVPADPDFLDPHKAEASLTFRMMLNVYEGLLNPTTDGDVEPAIAKKYKISDNGLVYTFTLRDGVKFHNGDPVTAEDVKYSFGRLMGTKTGKPLTADFNNIASIKTPDKKTVVITLKKQDSAFLSKLTALDAAILSKRNDGKQNDNPIGTGPFKFVEYKPQNHLVLKKFDDYWNKDLPYLDKVTFVFQPDDQAALLSLKGGQIDITSIAAHKISEVKDDFTIIKQNTNAIFLLGMNEKRKPFNDVRVRKAINYAINKDKIIEAVYSGYATKLGSHMSPAMGDYYKEDLEDYYATDLEKAKSLLAEAGYADGFSTTVTVSSHNNMYADAAQVIARQLKQVGIDVKINVVEWAKWLKNVYGNHNYDMTIIDFTGYLSPYQILERYRTGVSGNLMNYSNPEYDQLMKKVLKVTDKDKKVKLYKKAQVMLTKDAAAVYIADYQTIWAMDPKFEGFRTYPIFYLDMAHIKLK